MRSKHVQGLVAAVVAVTFLVIGAVTVGSIMRNTAAERQQLLPMCGAVLQQDTEIYQTIVEHRTASETWYEGYAAASTNLQIDLTNLETETPGSEIAADSVEFSKEQAAKADTNPNPATVAAFTAALTVADTDITKLMKECHATTP